MIELKCSSCGAQIELDNTREFGFCSYCGNKILIQQKNLIVNSEDELNNLIRRIDIFMEQNELTKVSNLIEKCINLYPNNYIGYWKRAEERSLHFRKLDWDVQVAAGRFLYDPYYNLYEKDKSYTVSASYYSIKRDIELALKYTDDVEIINSGQKYLSDCENAIDKKCNLIKSENSKRLNQLHTKHYMIRGLALPPVEKIYQVREKRHREFGGSEIVTSAVYCGIVAYNNTIYYRNVVPVRSPKKGDNIYRKGEISISDTPITFDSNFYIINKNTSQKILIDGKTVRLLAINEIECSSSDYESSFEYTVDFIFGTQKFEGRGLKVPMAYRKNVVTYREIKLALF